MLEEFLAERQRGRLFGPHLDSFVVTATHLGFARFTRRQQVLLLGDLERWLQRQCLALVDLDEQVVNQFLEKRRRQGRLWKGHPRTVSLFLEYLREKGAIPVEGRRADNTWEGTLSRRTSSCRRCRRSSGCLPAPTSSALHDTVRVHPEQAPHRGFAHPSSISTLVCRALKRAGLQPALMGAHIPRHSLAAGWLRSGASTGAIGQVLRHRVANTTEMYAKVDSNGLRSLALPWPTKGGES